MILRILQSVLAVILVATVGIGVGYGAVPYIFATMPKGNVPASYLDADFAYTLGSITSAAGVTSVLGATANGFAVSATGPTATPTIAVSTSVSGVAKGDGTTLSVATPGVDYVIPSGNVATANAFASSPATCPSGQYSLGVTATGSAVGCTLATTGTVNTVSIATANGISGSSSGGTTPSLTLALGAITPSSVNVGSGAISGVGTGLTGTATGLTAGTVITNANLSGDVTSTGSNATTVVKINGTSLAGLSTGILKNTTGTGVPSIALNSDLPAMTATVGGAVPTPPNNTTTFLRGDGTFASPTGSGTVNSSTAGNLAYYPSTGTAVSGVPAVANAVLSTNASGVPSESTTLPNGLAMQTPASITLTNGTGTAAGLSIGGSAGSATNVAGGAANQIPYQTGASTTSFMSAGANGLLVTNGSNIPSISTAIPNGVTATTQPSYDMSAKVATMSAVQAVTQLSMATLPMSGVTGGTYSFASNGSGINIGILATGGAITGYSGINSPGSGYKVGDLIIPQGGNHDAVFAIDALSGSGASHLTLLYAGTGYGNGSTAGGDAAASVFYTFTLTGTLTSDATFVVSNGTYLTQSNQWIINNNTTGAHNVIFKISNSSDTAMGTGVTIPQGSSNNAGAFIQTDGETDVWCTGGSCSTNLGTPSGIVLTNATGTAASLTAGHVTTNANLSGPITSSGNTTSITSAQGTSTTFQMASGVAVSGDCVKFDANGNAVDAGAACGGGGGSGTVNSSSAGNLAYYPSTGTAVSGIDPASVTVGTASAVVAGGTLGTGTTATTPSVGTNTTVVATAQFVQQNVSNPNDFVNGSFNVWQDTNGNAGTYSWTSTTTGHSADLTLFSAGTGGTPSKTVARTAWSKASATNVNNNAYYYSSVQTANATTTGDDDFFGIEGANKYQGSSVTVSALLWCASGTLVLTPTWGQNFGTGGSPSAAVLTAPNGASTITVTTTPTLYTLTFTVPATTAKTFGSNSNDYSGIHFTRPTSTLSTLNADSLKIEAGTVATPYRAPMGGVDAVQSKRYYEIIGGSVGSDILIYAYALTGGPTGFTLSSVTKRALPTGTKAGTWSVSNASQPVLQGVGLNSFAIFTTITTAGSGDALTASASTYISLDARLF